MKKTRIILICAAVLLLTLFIFRDPILDFLPIDQSRWIERDGSRYLLDEDGDPRTGWISLEAGTYYFREDGVMHTGWLEEEGTLCYFNPDGTLHTGWLTLEGKLHYFDDQGRLDQGFLEENGKRYFLDENGTPVSGWQQLEENICYVTEDGSIPTGWLELEGQTYYLTDQGFRCTGWLDQDSSRYYFTSNGTMALGWTEIEGQTYYFRENGSCHFGWLELEGKRYYLGTDGTLHTGWLEDNGNRYYLQPDGTAAAGKLEIDGENYFFSSTGTNFILVNHWNYLPEGFDVKLTEVFGIQVDPVCAEALEQMITDCRSAGYSPRIISGYRSVAAQKDNLQALIDTYLAKGYTPNAAYATAVRSVAVPGTSEHHLGLALDIVDAGYPNLNHQQATTPTQKWLMEHCWEYGFILRYPENSMDITGIIWEPWHYRYVGVEMALEIRNLGGITLEEYIDNLTNDGTTCGGKQPNA